MKKKIFLITGLIIIALSCFTFTGTNLYSYFYTCDCIDYNELETACQNYCINFMMCYAVEHDDYGLCIGFWCGWYVKLICVDGEHSRSKYYAFPCAKCL
jgi:hypothetical protein